MAFLVINPGKRSSRRNFYKCRWTFKARNTDQGLSLVPGYLKPRVWIVLLKFITCLLPLNVYHHRHRRRYLLSPISIHSLFIRSPATLPPTLTEILSWIAIAATKHHADSTSHFMHHNRPFPYHHTHYHQAPNHMAARRLAVAALGYLCHFARRHHHQTFLMF